MKHFSEFTKEKLQRRTESLQKRIEVTRRQRQDSLKKIIDGNPLDAEEEPQRKIDRIKRITGFDEEKAKKVTSHEEAALTDLSDEERELVDTALGKNKDFMNVAFLEEGRAAANTVGRIVHNSDGEPEGTGFMISPTLFMTNRHIFFDEDTPEEFSVEFNYELDAMNKRKSVTRLRFAPDVFYLSKYDDDVGLDFAIVAVSDPDNKLAEVGFCPMKNASDKHAKGDFANIIQHPGGKFKRMVLRKNQLVARLDNPPVLHYYNWLTDRGSSGSPIFNDQWELVGLHYGGLPFAEEYPDGTEIPKNVTEGTRISAIVKELENERNNPNNNLSLNQRDLIKEALECPFRYPSLLKTHVLEFTV